MPYFIKAIDTSGSVALHRDTASAALKKASELLSDGCWDVEITTPDGVAYPSTRFELLKDEVGS